MRKPPPIPQVPAFDFSPQLSAQLSLNCVRIEELARTLTARVIDRAIRRARGELPAVVLEKPSEKGPAPL